MTETNSSAVHQYLDTTYVNLASLLRYLQHREFAGRVHVELIEYEADVFLNAKDTPRVRELNHATGHEAWGEEALERLLIRSIESGGLISVYDSNEELMDGVLMSMSLPGPATEVGLESDADVSADEQEWHDLLRITGELIAAVERASDSAGADFETLFRTARLELGDDYSFLDPLSECLEYVSGGLVRLHARPGKETFVVSICECLHRVVSGMAKGPSGGRIRERVALELAVMARRKQSPLARFKLIQQFDRIAGTRVL